MLKIYIGSLQNEIVSASSYFDITYSPSWLNDNLNKKMILDVDKSRVISENIIESPILGPIPPQWLSGGVKALICMNSDNTGNTFNLSNCGDNCAKWAVEIGKRKDIKVSLHHFMDFTGVDDFQALILNSGKIVNSPDEYAEEFIKVTSNDDNKEE